jgi:hypothetical protein
LARYREHDLVLQARAQAYSPAAWTDYRRHRHLMEGSFAQSANCHGGKRSRWRRLWRQQIQDWLIAVCVNVKILIKSLRHGPLATESQSQAGPDPIFGSVRCALSDVTTTFTRINSPAAFESIQRN